LLISVALGWFLCIRIVAGFDFFLADVIFRLARPVLVQSCFLFFIYYTVPRRKLGIALTFIILRTFCLVFFIVLTPLLLFDVVPQLDPMNWKHWWAPFLGEVLTLAASVAIYNVLRKEHYSSGRVPELGI